ncbi:hypothetical protein KC717_05095 [Candidatus Dojkabacteria bacterium]|uniref:Uncharacterized protein n=1 Tax=Candidatus Dojkabacteria bacterium TaxID=2099670 RepID=A0A955L9E4_9BACT|nr:hypothetical protein [Candidatus Dojkabacteria bacterium]
MKHMFVKVRFFLSLLTWQTSLLIAAIAALALSGIIVVASPANENEIEQQTLIVKKTSYTKPVQVRFTFPLDSFDLLIYNNLQQEKSIPVEFEILEDGPESYIELFPGVYTFIVNYKDQTVKRDIVLGIDNPRVYIDMKFSVTKDGSLPEPFKLEIPNFSIDPPFSSPTN